MKLRALFLALTAGMFFVMCNKYSDQPTRDYSLAVTWPVHLDSLALFTNYNFSYQTGRATFDAVRAYTVPDGFIDTAAADLSLSTSTAKNGSVYFVKTGTGILFIESETGDHRIFKDSCAFIVRNPYSISGDTAISTVDTEKGWIVPRPDAARMAPDVKVEWKIDNIRCSVLNVSDTFAYSILDSGRHTIIASFIDTTSGKNFSAPLDTLPVHGAHISVTWPAHADSLVLFTSYPFSYQTAQNSVGTLHAYTVRNGSADTGAVNLFMVNGALKTGSFYLVNSGTYVLYVTIGTSSHTLARDSCIVTVRNPYSISGDTAISTFDTEKVRIVPEPDAARMAPNVKVEWKIDNVRSSVLNVSDTFAYSVQDSGRHTIIASFIDTTDGKSFSSSLDTLQVFCHYLSVTWPAHTDSLALCTSYSFAYRTGPDTIKALRAYAVRNGSIDTASVNLFLVDSTLQTGSFYLATTGTYALYITGETPGHMVLKASCTVTVRNPYSIIGDSAVFSVDTAHLSISPQPDMTHMLSTIKVEWKVNNVRRSIMNVADTFYYSAPDSGRYAITASFIDSSNGKKFSAPLDTVPVHMKKYVEVTYISGSTFVTLFLKADGTLWSCGINNSGLLGDSTTNNRAAPKCIMTNVKTASAGYNHCLAVKNDGSLWAWGSNIDGQLGNGATSSGACSVPIKVIYDSVQSAGAGFNYSVALKTDGTVWTWGLNDVGQLGSGNNSSDLLPKKRTSGVRSIAVGIQHNLALKTDGTLWGWGASGYGQLGDSTGSSSPKQVPLSPSISGIQNIFASPYSSFFITGAGYLYDCGMNTSGLLGDGTSATVKAFKSVMIGVQTIASSGPTTGYHTIFLKNTGELWACGDGSLGQFANSIPTQSLTPVLVASGGVKNVFAGTANTFLISTNGMLWGCGSNSGGILGDGTTSTRYLLTKILF